MHKILFSLTTLFAISITGCLDDAQKPEPEKVLTAEQHPETQQAPSDQAARNDLPDLPDQPVTMQQELDESGVVNAGSDDTDRMFCNTVADCEDGYWCRIDTNRCILAKH